MSRKISKHYVRFLFDREGNKKRDEEQPPTPPQIDHDKEQPATPPQIDSDNEQPATPPQIDRDEDNDDDNVEPADEDSDENDDDDEIHKKEVKRYASFCMQMKSMNK